MKESISMEGRPMPGFALGEPVGVGQDGVASSKYAALMTGAATGLLVYVLQAPVWGAVLAGAAAAVVTKASIDRAAA